MFIEEADISGKSQRIGYIDALRGFTMFMVVFMHVGTVCWGIVGKGISLHDFLGQVRMPMFFFISGFVLYREGVVWNMRHIVSFFKKKVPVQLISPFIFFAVFLHISGIPLADGVMDKYKLGYWFTLVLLEFFVIYAVVRCCVRSWWYKIILVAIGLVLYGCCSPHMTTGHHTIDNMFLLLSVHQWRYFIFLVLGALTREHFATVQAWLDGKWLLVVCILFYFLVNAFGDVLPVHEKPLRFMLSLSGLVILFAFFRSKQACFSRETRLGRVMQYTGRRTLDIYLIHYFLIPRNLSFITVFTDHPMPIIEAAASSLISILIIAACLLISNIIRLSPWLAHWLFGAKSATSNSSTQVHSPKSDG